MAKAEVSVGPRCSVVRCRLIDPSPSGRRRPERRPPGQHPTRRRIRASPRRGSAPSTRVCRRRRMFDPSRIQNQLPVPGGCRRVSRSAVRALARSRATRGWAARCRRDIWARKKWPAGAGKEKKRMVRMLERRCTDKRIRLCSSCPPIFWAFLNRWEQEGN